MRQCTVLGCQRPHYGKGSCKLHYQRRVSKSRSEYYTWFAMRRRCYNPSHQYYKYYGGRSIKVCDRWNSSFTNFLEDMGKRPLKMTLERINNDGDYEPGNCKWATASENNSNRSVSPKNR